MEYLIYYPILGMLLGMVNIFRASAKAKSPMPGALAFFVMLVHVALWPVYFPIGWKAAEELE